MNKVILIGRLTRDPQLRFTPGSGAAVTNFTLAVDKSYVGQDGKREADFLNIVCWRKLAEHVANNLSKGRLVAVAGSIQTRKYQAEDGSNRYVTEIVATEVKFLDWGNKDGSQATNPIEEGNGGGVPSDDTEIPF